MKLAVLLVILIGTAAGSYGQRVAILGPEHIAESLKTSLTKRFRVLDNSLARSAYSASGNTDNFNLTAEQSREIGTLLGTDHFVIVRSETLQRQSVDAGGYFESFAAIFVVDARSGRLIGFRLESAKSNTESSAKASLENKIPSIDEFITVTIERSKAVPDPPRNIKFPPVPEADSSAAKDLKTPIPYNRIRPEYTSAAYLYSVAATVEIEVDIDVDGSIARTSIERWAGFGLEESVEKAVRSMNWRPAMKGGKPLPMRVLLRYNFTKITKDEVP
jgi:hypothetical protein